MSNETQTVNDQTRIYIFLILACFLVFANSLSGDFVFDDAQQIVNNPALFSWSNLIKAFTTDVWAFQRETGVKNIPPPYYRPLFTVYLTVGYQLFGLWQQGWHLLNLAVHTGATILVFRFFQLLTENKTRLSFIAALFFALLPVHVESVSWISGVPDPLAALFYLPSAMFYIHWRKSGDKKNLVYALVLYFLALLSKETPIVLPAILFIWEITFNRLKDSKLNFIDGIKQTLPFVIPVIVYLIMRFSVLGKVTWKHPFITQTPTELIYLTTPFSFVYYLKNIIFPYHLSLIYDTRFIKGMDDLLLWIPLLIIGILVGTLIYFRRKMTNLMWLAVALFIFPLLPVLNLQVFHYEYIVQDRYLYLPSIGFVLLIAALLSKLWDSEKKIYQQIALSVTVLLCVFYSVSTILQNRVWSSEIALWTRAIEVKNERWASYYNVGLARYLEKNYEGAIKDFDTALNLALTNNKDSVDRKDDLILVNRGLSKKGLGQIEEAKKDFQKALEFDAKSVEALSNLGVVYFEQNNYVEAEKQLRAAQQIDSNNPFVLYNLGKTLAQLQRDKEAISLYETLLKSQKLDAELMYFAAVSYSKTGQTETAKKLFANADSLAKDEALKEKIKSEMQKLK